MDKLNTERTDKQIEKLFNKYELLFIYFIVTFTIFNLLYFYNNGIYKEYASYFITILSIIQFSLITFDSNIFKKQNKLRIYEIKSKLSSFNKI